MHNGARSPKVTQEHFVKYLSALLLTKSAGLHELEHWAFCSLIYAALSLGEIFLISCPEGEAIKFMHQQFNIQQLYVLPTLYLCVLYLSENKQRLVPLTA